MRDMKAKGALGMKCFGYRPDILEAAFDELKKQGMRSACHHAQLDVTRVNVLTTARWGLTTMEHWYGLPEALFDDRTVQDYPAGLQLQQRAGPLRPGRPAVGAGRDARAARNTKP